LNKLTEISHLREDQCAALNSLCIRETDLTATIHHQITAKTIAVHSASRSLINSRSHLADSAFIFHPGKLDENFISPSFLWFKKALTKQRCTARPLDGLFQVFGRQCIDNYVHRKSLDCDGTIAKWTVTITRAPHE
jgi:hypothetical protein